MAYRILQLEKELKKRDILKGTIEEDNECLPALEVDRDECIQDLENRTAKLESSIDELWRNLEGVKQKINEILSS